MKDYLNLIIEKIQRTNPFQYKSLTRYLDGVDNDFKKLANNYLEKYLFVLSETGINFDEAVSAYDEMSKSILKEQIYFLKNKKYRYSTISEAEEKVYSNLKFMTNYMIGVAFSQFLWKNHSDMFNFFKNYIKEYKGRNYLEVGPGHGLFFQEAMNSNNFENYLGVDISGASLQSTKSIIEKLSDNNNYQLINKNIMDFNTNDKFDFITMGEVLEHVEEPEKLLMKLNSILSNKGRAYISTCVNAPVIDHIYLFNNVKEIRDMIVNCGFEIESEIVISNDNIPKERWEEERSNISYAAILKNK